MILLTGILAYPAFKIGMSLTGANDFLSAGSHLLYGNVKKSAFSLITAGFKLGLTAGAISILYNSIFSSAPRERVAVFNNNPFNVPKEAESLKDWSFVKNSTPERIAQYCTYYFKDSPVNNYDISYNCLSKISNLDFSHGFKKWVLEDPIAAAFVTSKTVEIKGLGDIAPLADCTNENRLSGNVYRSESSTTLSSEAKPCEENRLRFLDVVLSQPHPSTTVRLAKGACGSVFDDPCSDEKVQKAKEAYFKQK